MLCWQERGRYGTWLPYQMLTEFQGKALRPKKVLLRKLFGILGHFHCAPKYILGKRTVDFLSTRKERSTRAVRQGQSGSLYQTFSTHIGQSQQGQSHLRETNKGGGFPACLYMCRHTLHDTRHRPGIICATTLRPVISGLKRASQSSNSVSLG